MIFALYISRIRQNNHTVGCDIYNYIYTKENFLTKFVKFLAMKISDYTVYHRKATWELT